MTPLCRNPQAMPKREMAVETVALPFETPCLNAARTFCSSA